MKDHKVININQPTGGTADFEIFGRPIEEEMLQIKRGYIMRLKHYTEKVKNTIFDPTITFTQQNDVEHKMAVIALLGYLEALEFLTPQKMDKNERELQKLS